MSNSLIASTWSDMVAAEPRLNDLLDEALWHRLECRSDDWCAAEIMNGYGAGAGKGIKQCLKSIVGLARADDHELLSTPEAYEIAMTMIWNALPPCGCKCGCVKIK